MPASDETSAAAPTTARIPRHVAIIMDGNGRWARRRLLPRPAGHREGVKAAQRVVRACYERGVEALTLFAFSSENWQRPEKEVSLLMDLFLTTLRGEIRRLHSNNVRLRFIGDRSAFADKLRGQMDEAERLTAGNSGLTLVIAANYGGRWDITQAARRIAEEVRAGCLAPEQIDTDLLERHLCLHDLPPPDLLIRTGGEQRISNFLLWQLAYTELFFSERLWPDFDAAALDEAFQAYAQRQRRFGRTDEQVEKDERA
ncbi:MAG TPA: isoprenyl transferase [Candidatus Competibacteraceae bacterium]|nr:isoprenyl transferase [Candidatus Competibacteraceae bacterium]